MADQVSMLKYVAGASLYNDPNVDFTFSGKTWKSKAFFRPLTARNGTVYVGSYGNSVNTWHCVSFKQNAADSDVTVSTRYNGVLYSVEGAAPLNFVWGEPVVIDIVATPTRLEFFVDGTSIGYVGVDAGNSLNSTGSFLPVGGIDHPTFNRFTKETASNASQIDFGYYYIEIAGAPEALWDATNKTASDTGAGLQDSIGTRHLNLSWNYPTDGTQWDNTIATEPESTAAVRRNHIITLPDDTAPFTIDLTNNFSHNPDSIVFVSGSHVDLSINNSTNVLTIATPAAGALPTDYTGIQLRAVTANRPVEVTQVFDIIWDLDGWGGKGSGIDSTSPLYASLNLPADNDNRYRTEVVTAPASGTLHSFNNGTQYVLEGAADGAHVGTFKLYENEVDIGNFNHTFNVNNAADTTPPVITLLGGNPLELTVGDTYTEPGATASDNVDGDISVNIVITGTVDTATAGAYTRRYNVSDAAGNAATEVTRTVNVSAAPDTTKPVISLVGASVIELDLYAPYVEQGATATDNVDGDISANIVITGTVDTSTAGSYQRLYNVSDAAGNAADQVIRTINVTDPNPASATFAGHVKTAKFIGVRK